jgi:hypothetical protein
MVHRRKEPSPAPTHAMEIAAYQARQEHERRAAAADEEARKYRAELSAEIEETSRPSSTDPDEDPLSPCRYDGWTGEKQRRFLGAIANGYTVRDACAFVGMSVASAYAYKRRQPRSAFALGWRAAAISARDPVADMLFERAVEGVREHVVTRSGESVVRKRYDNRLAMALLNRLDRQADALSGIDGPVPPDAAPVQVIVQHWDDFIRLVDSTPDVTAISTFIGERIVGALALSPPQQDADATEASERKLVQLRSHEFEISPENS